MTTAAATTSTIESQSQAESRLVGFGVSDRERTMASSEAGGGSIRGTSTESGESSRVGGGGR